MSVFFGMVEPPQLRGGSTDDESWEPRKRGWLFRPTRVVETTHVGLREEEVDLHLQIVLMSADIRQLGAQNLNSIDQVPQEAVAEAGNADDAERCEDRPASPECHRHRDEHARSDDTEQ